MNPLPYPRNIFEFTQAFSTEDACWAYLARSRWGKGWRCRRCGSREKPYALQPRRLIQCRVCGLQTSVTAGSIMHRTKVPLLVWFWAAWFQVTKTPGVSALQLARQVGIRNYETVFMLLHKLRAATVRRDRAKLTGVVESDETYVGGHRLGRMGRKRDPERALVAAAVEVTDQGHAGRLRLRAIPDASSESLVAFLSDVVEPWSTVRTDGWAGYSGIREAGFTHQRVIADTPREAATVVFPHVHRVFSNLKAFLIGTHHGVSPWHLQSYLNEFTFRFNRRKHPMAAFRSLLGLVEERDAPTYERLYRVRGKEPGAYVHPNPPASHDDESGGEVVLPG